MFIHRKKTSIVNIFHKTSFRFTFAESEPNGKAKSLETPINKGKKRGGCFLRTGSHTQTFSDF